MDIVLKAEGGNVFNYFSAIEMIFLKNEWKGRDCRLFIF